MFAHTACQRHAIALLHLVEVVRELHPFVHGHQINDIQLRSLRLQPSGNPLQLLLIFRRNVRPRHLLRQGPQLLPVVVHLMGHAELNGLLGVFNLRVQQVAMLKPARRRVTL